MLLVLSNNDFAQTWIPLDDIGEGQCVSTEVLTSNPATYCARIKIHGFYDTSIIRDNVTYHILALDNDITLDDIGSPALPVITKLLENFRGTTYNASIEEISWKNINVGKIYPYQKPLLEMEEDTVFSINTTVYNQTSYFPAILTHGENQVWRGFNNKRYIICPFKYYPLNDRLSVLCEFILNVSFDGTGTVSHQRRSLSLSNGMPVCIFDNVYSLAEIDEINRDDVEQYDYLIIVGTSSSISGSSEMESFRRWKALKGLKTKVVTTAITGITPTQIKQYIAEEYTKGIKYVLFVGDNDAIPLYDWYSPYKSIFIPSDYWYGCVDGNDDEADIAIGRFPTNTLSEFSNMINKTIGYEKGYNEHTNNVLLVAHKELGYKNYQGCCNEIKNASYNDGVVFETAYGATIANQGDAATNQDVLDKINEGVNIINYRGHGGETCWYHWNFLQEDFGNALINQMTNSIYPVVLSIACQTGQVKNQSSMLNTYMRSIYGSSLFLGATVNSNTNANHSFDKFLFSKLLNEQIYNVGWLNNLSHIANLMGNPSIHNAYCYICGGDPSLEIWTGESRTFNINISNVSNGLLINTQDVTNTQIAVVLEDGEVFDLKNISGNSVILDNLPPQCYISINKHNYHPYIIYYDEDSDYIQNMTINNYAYYANGSLSVGNHVQQSLPHGDVIVKDGGTLDIRLGGDVIISSGFECEKGGVFIVR